MCKGKLAILLVSILALTIFTACENGLNPGGCGGSTTDTNTTTDTATTTSTDSDTSSNTGVDTGTTNIVLNGNTISADTAYASVNGAVVTITAGGTYNVTGSLSNGQIIIAAGDEDKVHLNLNGVTIRCSTSAPIYVKSADKLVVELGDNSQNSLTDGVSYVFEAGSDEPNAALFSKSDLTIKGDGALTVTGNYNDGISTKDDLKIKGGTISVKAADDGIRGKDSIEIEGGDITVNAGGDGLKSDNADDVSKGYITISAGKLNIAATGDGIAAETDVTVVDGDTTIISGGGSNRTVSGDASAKGIKGNAGVAIDGGKFNLNCADDTIHSNGNIEINGGNIILASADDGIKADETISINGGDIRITKSYEGIEGAIITINDGNISLVSRDDGVNVVGAGGSTEGRPGQAATATNQFLYMNGGYLAVNANGDGLDINGAMRMKGGTVVVHGPTANNNGPLDYNSINITGGFIVAAGSSGMAQAAGSTSSTQNAFLLKFSASQQAGSLVNIQTAAGKSILTFAPAKTYKSITISSPELVRGTSYRVYTGGSCTGTVKDGLYQGGTYTPGTQYTTFTVSSALTTSGSTSWFPR